MCNASLGWIMSASPPEGRVEAAVVGGIAPDFTLPALGEEAISLSQLRDRPVVLNFWATWCPPCRGEMPYIQAVHEEIAAGELSVLTVNVGEPRSKAREFVEGQGLTFPVALDHDGQVSEIYGLRYFPTTFFIDEEGVIRGMKVGAFRDKAQLLAALESIR